MSGAVNMKTVSGNVGRIGYTAVELMVTIVLVSVLAAVVGTFFVKLLGIQERDREEAYIREKLADICALYADQISIGSYFSAGTNQVDQASIVKYRQETGGVSFETGVVTRVAYLKAAVNRYNKNGLKNLDVTVYSTESSTNLVFVSELGSWVCQKRTTSVTGDAYLFPLTAEMIGCTVRPLNFTPGNTTNDVNTGWRTTDAVLGYLEVSARYITENDFGEEEAKIVTAGRLVRLWNRE